MKVFESGYWYWYGGHGWMDVCMRTYKVNMNKVNVTFEVSSSSCPVIESYISFPTPWNKPHHLPQYAQMPKRPIMYANAVKSSCHHPSLIPLRTSKSYPPNHPKGRHQAHLHKVYACAPEYPSTAHPCLYALDPSTWPDRHALTEWQA